MKTVKHVFQMEDPNYIGFQNYQPVTTKEILYSVIKATAEGKKKSTQLGMNYQYQHAMWALHHTVVTEEQANNIQAKIKVSNTCFSEHRSTRLKW